MPPSTARRQYSNSRFPLQHVSSSEDSPTSSSQLSSTVDLTHEYTLALRSNSYSEIWSKIYHSESSYLETNVAEAQDHEEQMVSNGVLQPSQECVREALQSVRPNTLIPLVSAYFDHSERTSRLCLVLRDSIIRARFLYHDIHNIINCFPLDSDAHSLTESQCNWAFDVFLQFDKLDNPFPQPRFLDLYDLCHCFSELHQQIHHKLCKLHSRMRLLHHATSCFIPCFVGKLPSSCHPSKLTKKELMHLSQLNTADRGTYILHDLNTIDRLVDRLHSSVEGDKFLVRLGLERGRDRYPIQQVVKQLKKNHACFLVQLLDLEEHLCLCFAAINRARSLLLEEICLH